MLMNIAFVLSACVASICGIVCGKKNSVTRALNKNPAFWTLVNDMAENEPVAYMSHNLPLDMAFVSSEAFLLLSC